MATFRDKAWTLSPARLRTAAAARFVYALIGTPLDAIAEAANQATKARFPSLAPDDALAYHGRDRGIVRGTAEAAESYRARLLLWIEAWRGAGIGRGMLDQLAGFILPKVATIRIWTQVGVVYTRAKDGTFTIERATGGGWNWDGQTSLWARFWVIFYSPIVGGVLEPGAPWDRDGTWGDGEVWGSDPHATWGSTATIEEVTAIRGIVDDWRPAPSVCKNIIVAFDSTIFDPGDTAPPLPDGTWGHWGRYVSGARRAARDPRAIYWRGVS